jgi:hypothetical protein
VVSLLSGSLIGWVNMNRMLYILLATVSTFLWVGIVAGVGKLTPLATGLFVGVAVFAIVSLKIPRPGRLKTRRALYVFASADWGLLANLFIFSAIYNSPIHSAMSIMSTAERTALSTLPGVILGALLGEWVGWKLGYILPNPP